MIRILFTLLLFTAYLGCFQLSLLLAEKTNEIDLDENARNAVIGQLNYFEKDLRDHFTNLYPDQPQKADESFRLCFEDFKNYIGVNDEQTLIDQIPCKIQYSDRFFSTLGRSCPVLSSENALSEVANEGKTILKVISPKLPSVSETCAQYAEKSIISESIQIELSGDFDLFNSVLSVYLVKQRVRSDEDKAIIEKNPQLLDNWVKNKTATLFYTTKLQQGIYELKIPENERENFYKNLFLNKVFLLARFQAKVIKKGTSENDQCFYERAHGLIRAKTRVLLSPIDVNATNYNCLQTIQSGLKKPK